MDSPHCYAMRDPISVTSIKKNRPGIVCVKDGSWEIGEEPSSNSFPGWTTFANTIPNPESKVNAYSIRRRSLKDCQDFSRVYWPHVAGVHYDTKTKVCTPLQEPIRHPSREEKYFSPTMELVPTPKWGSCDQQYRPNSNSIVSIAPFRGIHTTANVNQVYGKSKLHTSHKNGMSVTSRDANKKHEKCTHIPTTRKGRNHQMMHDKRFCMGLPTNHKGKNPKSHKWLPDESVVAGVGFL